MKNLSIQTLPVPTATNFPVKTTAEPSVKSNFSAGNHDSAVLPSPFQKELSKHVDKPTQVKHNSSAQQEKTDTAKHVLKNHAAQKENHAGQAEANRKNVLKSQPRDGNGEDGGRDADVDVAKIAAASNELEDNQLLKIESATLSSAELGAENIDKDAELATGMPESLTVDASLLGLAVPVITPTINANPQLVAQIATTAKDGVDAAQDNIELVAGSANKQGSEFTPLSEAEASIKPNYDEALNQALLSNKNVNALETDVKAKQGLANGVGNTLDKSSSADHARWLEAVLPSTSKQNLSVNEGDALVNKASAHANQVAIESSIKGQALPPGIQIAAQVSAAFSSAQQAGSANTISSYPGKSGWDQAISQKVVWMVGAGEQSATLTLNPPDLGPLQVVIRVHNDQADTTFISNNAEVRQALENGLSNLREKMSESGIQLGQANVSADNQSQQAFQRATQNRPGVSTKNNGEVDSQLILDASKAPVRNANGLVDTFA